MSEDSNNNDLMRNRVQVCTSAGRWWKLKLDHHNSRAELMSAKQDKESYKRVLIETLKTLPCFLKQRGMKNAKEIVEELSTKH